MKKFTAFLVAMMMLAGVVSAFAATPSIEDPSGAAALNGEGNNYIVWTDGDTGDAADPEGVAAAQSHGSALDVLPEDIRALLPANYTVVNEFGLMEIKGLITGDLQVAFRFNTPYPEDSVVYLAIGIPGEAGTEWTLVEAKGNEEQNVVATFALDLLEKIGDKAVTVMVISEA